MYSVGGMDQGLKQTHLWSLHQSTASPVLLFHWLTTEDVSTAFYGKYTLNQIQKNHPVHFARFSSDDQGLLHHNSQATKQYTYQALEQWNKRYLYETFISKMIPSGWIYTWFETASMQN